MFRTDNMADSGNGGGGAGGVSSRKAHPIFKNSKRSDSGGGGGGPGLAFWSLSSCKIDLSNNDPRFRPPICCVIVGAIVLATGIFVVSFTDDSAAVIAGGLIVGVGALIIFSSLAWLFVARKKIMKLLDRKALPMSSICIDRSVDGCRIANIPMSMDPVMTRGLITITYRGCEDTISPRGRQCVSGTKSVRIPPKDDFLSVESTCFQLIATPADMKADDGGKYLSRPTADRFTVESNSMVHSAVSSTTIR